MLQGKPIMARIKAKPMAHRLPIAPVGIPIKNGFKTTPPPPVYDPVSAAAFTPQRFHTVYTNGTTIPAGAVPYSLFVSIELELKTISALNDAHKIVI